MSSNAASRSRLFGLDLFRIVCALFIFLFHSQMHIGCDYGFLNNFISMGAIFMTAFFLLSGLSLSYTNHGRDFTSIESIFSFYKKRFRSILPLYWFICIFYPFYDVIVNQGSAIDNFLLLPLEMLGLQQVFHSLFSVSHNGGTWFISCLLFCYAAFPFLSRVFNYMKETHRKMLCLVLIALCIYSPFVVVYFNISDIYSNIFFRLIEFSIGVLIFSLIRNPGKVSQSKKSRVAFLFFCSILFLLICLVSLGIHFSLFVNNYMIYNLISLPLFCILLVVAFSIPKAPDKISRLFTYLSEISYAFFLAQFFVWKLTTFFCLYTGIDRNLPKIVISFSLCLLISIFMHEIIEKNVRKLIEKSRISL